MKGLQVILIDDDPTVNFISRTMMKHHGFSSEIRSFTNAQEALDALGSLEAVHEPSCIFLDLNMPVMDGWEFLEAFKQLPPVITAYFPIFILTSSVSDTDRQKAATYKEVKEFISKPIYLVKLDELKSKYFSTGQL